MELWISERINPRYYRRFGFIFCFASGFITGTATVAATFILFLR